MSLRAAVMATALVTLSLAGCGTLRGTREIPTVDPVQAAAFELEGRINLRAQKEAFPGRVRWQHDPAADELWFYSPVGSAVARMRQDADGALLITAEGEEHRARNLRELAFRILGWDLPLDSLPYWVRGLELPGAPAEQERDAAGRLRLLRQNGWEVAYLDWTPAGVRGLPSKLDIQGERLRLRLVVEAWRIDARPR